MTTPVLQGGMKTADRNHAKGSRSSSPSATFRSERLLFALSKLERDICPIEAPDSPEGKVEIRWFDSSQNSHEAWTDLLENYRPTAVISCWSTPTIPEKYLQSPSCALRYICHVSGSVRHVIPRLFIEQGGWVTNWGDTVAPQVAEQALLLALGSLREIRQWESFIRQAEDGPRHPIMTLGTRTLFGQNVGLHGFGRIARVLVSLLKPFQVSISAYSAGVPDSFIEEHDVIPCRSLTELFAKSSILFECEALTPATEKSVTGEILSSLPNHAVFVNVGRGKVVDEMALLREVASGRLRAALDVVASEPVNGRNPLLNEPGTLLSPHIGGPTNDRYPACAKAALANLTRYLQQQPLSNLMSAAEYDRST